MRAYRDVNLSQHTSEYLMCAYRDTNLSQHTSAYVRQVEMHACRDVNLHTHPLMAQFFFSFRGVPRKREPLFSRNPPVHACSLAYQVQHVMALTKPLNLKPGIWLTKPCNFLNLPLTKPQTSHFPVPASKAADDVQDDRCHIQRPQSLPRC